jgi:hypothetical protein
VNFFKKIGGICWGVVKKETGFPGRLPRTPERYSNEAPQLLLDKAGELIYLYKIFQHISVGVVRERRPGRKPASRQMTWAECLESINNTVNRS